MSSYASSPSSSAERAGSRLLPPLSSKLIGDSRAWGADAAWCAGWESRRTEEGCTEDLEDAILNNSSTVVAVGGLEKVCGNQAAELSDKLGLSRSKERKPTGAMTVSDPENASARTWSQP